MSLRRLSALMWWTLERSHEQFYPSIHLSTALNLPSTSTAALQPVDHILKHLLCLSDTIKIHSSKATDWVVPLVALACRHLLSATHNVAICDQKVGWQLDNPIDVIIGRLTPLEIHYITHTPSYLFVNSRCWYGIYHVFWDQIGACQIWCQTYFIIDTTVEVSDRW